MTDDTINWSPGDLRSAAQKIHDSVDKALDNHENAWQQMQEHIGLYLPFLQDVLQAIMDENQKRYRMAYEWQKSFADVLTKNAEIIEVGEQDRVRDINKSEDEGTSDETI